MSPEHRGGADETVARILDAALRMGRPIRI